MATTMQNHGQQMKVNRRLINTNVNVRCFTIILCRKTHEFAVMLIYSGTGLYFISNFLILDGSVEIKQIFYSL